MRNKVLIYKDYGCADVSALEQELRAYFEPRGCEVSFTDAAGIIYRNELNHNVLAFFMPGGASTPYRHKLEVLGNQKIRAYVRTGGIYYGICAGAYYACRRTIFEKDIPQARIIEDYKLDLVEAQAVGSLYKELNIAPFSHSPSSSAAVEIFDENGNSAVVHYHGGPYFEPDKPDNLRILARYNLEESKPAVILRRYGRGSVILSGVHFEDRGDRLAKTMGETSETTRKLSAHEASRLAFFQKLMSLSKR